MICLYAHQAEELEQFIIAATNLTKSYSRQVSNVLIYPIIIKIQTY